MLKQITVEYSLFIENNEVEIKRPSSLRASEYRAGQQVLSP